MEHSTVMDPPDRPERREPGALAKLAADPSSRKRFLRMVGGAGAATAFTTLLSACGSEKTDPSFQNEIKRGSTAQVQFGEGDLGILNFALVLEYVEADLYRKAAESGILKGKYLEMAKKFGEQEQEHADAVLNTVLQMGGHPTRRPKASFPLNSRREFLTFTASLENLGASAYLGQAPHIQDPEILSAALTIHSVEARHAAILNKLVGRSITPDGAFAKPRTLDQVVNIAKPLIAS